MPDLNSVPPSPHPSGSRRPSSNQTAQAQMPPPAVPTSPNLNILPSNQPIVNQTASSSSLPSPGISHTAGAPIHAVENAAVGPGPGPIRHPRPMTAADLHLELEKEQEAVVNRLTRELSLLRAAQNSSVVSNTSSTSASESGHAQQPSSSLGDTHLMSGPGFVPTTIDTAARRHHRTNSTTSTRSTQGSTPITAPIPIHHGSSNAAASLEAARNPRGAATSMSRQNSSTSHRSRTRSPAPGYSSSYTQSHLSSYPPQDSSYFPRPGLTSNPSTTAATPGSELSPGLLPATLRYEETAFYRQELETAKRENDTLRKRIKELEKMVRERRESDASQRSVGQGGGRLRSDSVSTTASVSVSGAAGIGGGGTGIAGERTGDRSARRGLGDRITSTTSVAGSVAVGVPEDEVKVGESAASAGLRDGAQ